ncbi:gamma-glutamyl-gamma-aminobutyrate hydrolase family protein [Saccharomonospora sp. NPDC006951]
MIPVGVTQRVLVEPRYGEQRLALDRRWAPFLAACGIVAVALPLEERLAERTLTSTRCAGVLFTGGDDLAEFGGTANERDRMEYHVLRYAIERALPVVGVCRGMQLLLRAFGAELAPVTGHAGTTHALTGELGPRTVNSFHRWAALDVPEGFHVTARSGQVVEGVVHERLALTGIMWHPERADASAEEDIALFTRAFPAAAS